MSDSMTIKGESLCATALAARARRAAHRSRIFFIVCLGLLFRCNLLSRFCIFTAHRCKTVLQSCKMAAHRCGGHYTAEKRPRIYAERITRLQIDRAYMRGALHGCFMVAHQCAVVLQCYQCSPHLCGEHYMSRFVASQRCGGYFFQRLSWGKYCRSCWRYSSAVRCWLVFLLNSSTNWTQKSTICSMVHSWVKWPSL